jgi:hypothetical protein
LAKQFAIAPSSFTPQDAMNSFHSEMRTETGCREVNPKSEQTSTIHGCEAARGATCGGTAPNETFAESIDDNFFSVIEHAPIKAI